MNVYEKLQSARVQLQDKQIKKTGKNSYSNFEYFELSDFLPEVNKIFDSLKLFSLFKLAEKSAGLTIYNAENPEEFIEFTMPAASLTLKGCNELQALGGANTYCRRYLYLNALEIVESDLFDAEMDRDNAKSVKKEKQKESDNIPADSGNDLDIFEGLRACSDTAAAAQYYKENLKFVVNKKEFYKTKQDFDKTH